MIALDPSALRLLAALVPALIIATLLLHARRRRRAAREIGDPRIVRMILGADLEAAPWTRFALVAMAASLLGLALLDPTLASPSSRPAGPVVLLLDASGSMLVEDVGAARIEAQRDLARRIVRELSDLPIGLVAFSGRAFTLAPPTRDRRSLEMYLSTIDPTIVTQSGSAMGAAIRQGIGLLSTPGSSRGGTLVLLGDGDETADADGALEAAALARRAGLVVHTIGVGTAAGAPVPALDLATGRASGFLRDSIGEIRISRRSENLLRSVASRGGGRYAAAEQEGEVEAVIGAAAGVTDEPERGEGREIPLYAWLAGAALACLLAEPGAAKLGRRG